MEKLQQKLYGKILIFSLYESYNPRILRRSRTAEYRVIVNIIESCARSNRYEILAYDLNSKTIKNSYELSAQEIEKMLTQKQDKNSDYFIL